MRSSRAIYSVLGRILAGLFIFSIAIVAVFWSVLESGALSDRQRRLVSEIMTDQIGQNVRFDGVIKARLGWNIKVWVEDVSVQSRGMSTVDVLHVNEVRFELNTWQLLQGRIDWDNLILSGADFLFLKQVGGRTSWKLGESTSENEAGRGKVKDRFLELLRDKNIEITDSSLMLDFRDSGFVFRFYLEVLEFLQEKDSHLTRMDGTGKLNGQDFNVQGAFPAESQFNAALQVGGTTSTVSGMPISGLGGHEFEAALTTEFASVGDFQEAIGLKRTSEGQGSLQAQLGGSARDIAVQALEINLDGTDGGQLRIDGSIDNLFRLQGANLAVSVIFPDPVTVLQPAQRLFKINLEQISADISGEPENLELKNIALKTNAFNPKFKKIGPIEVGNLFRTDEGEISLSGIRLTAGGPDNPYLTVDGEIGNALELQQVALKAHLNIQATELFPLVNFEDETALGRVTGDLLVSDGSGALSLDQLNLQTSETDLWDTSVSVAVKDLERLGEVESDIELVLEEPATFLGLLGIQTSVTDPIAFKWSTQKAGEAKLDIKAALDFARTGFETQMTAGFRSYKPTLSGKISGESVHVSDIRSFVALGKSISGLVEDPYANRIAKPLVITREAKPLVIAREAKPLVLGNPNDVFRMDRLLKDAEVHIAIEISKILGVPAVNTVNAVLKIDEGIARLEPIVVSVVGGTATAAITSNLQNKPSRLTAKGHLRGVGLKTLMTLANSDLDAQGSISGPFSLSLDIKQRSNLLQSISGTARLSLAESRIATSLLNLAGLGVIPWLFSKELQKGYTDISFAIMPVELSRGIVMLNNAVIETPKVRVLVHGQINLLNKTLYIRAIPRPLNRADARSRFPVTLSGSLFSPKVSIERGEDSGRQKRNPIK